MAQRTVQGSEALAKKIKTRRNELGLTIEEAASRAGVGTKTWSRYESGESIRQDKCKGICRALNWRSFPDEQDEEEPKDFIEVYKAHEAWSPYLAEYHGLMAAASFAAGSDLLLDYIQQDLMDLASMPVGSHVGQLNASFINDELPPQYLMRYNYDFLYQMKAALIQLRETAKLGKPVVAHSVLEELIIYLCNEEAKAFMEVCEGIYEFDEEEAEAYDEDWIFDLFGDMDIITFLYSDMNLDKSHSYAFEHWNERKFYRD